jgi:hypothetical protein
MLRLILSIPNVQGDVGEITQLTFALPSTVVCNQFMSTCKVISQKWRSPVQLFGQQYMTPDNVKVEVMYKLFHQHMPPDKVNVEVMGVVEMTSDSRSSSCSRGSRGRG